MSQGSSGPNFGGDLNGDFVQGDQTKTEIAGDNVAGDQDKSQTSNATTNVAGDVVGDVNTQGGDNVQGGQVNVLQQVESAFDEMVKVAEELGVETPTVAREIPQKPKPDEAPDAAAVAKAEEAEAAASADTPEPEEISFEDFEAEAIDDGSDHPALVMASVRQMESSDAAPTEEEQKGLFSRAYSCVVKYGTSPGAIGAMKLAASGITALATTPPPFNIIGPVLGTAIKLAGGKE